LITAPGVRASTSYVEADGGNRTKEEPRFREVWRKKKDQYRGPGEEKISGRGTNMKKSRGRKKNERRLRSSNYPEKKIGRKMSREPPGRPVMRD